MAKIIKDMKDSFIVETESTVENVLSNMYGQIWKITVPAVILRQLKLTTLESSMFFNIIGERTHATMLKHIYSLMDEAHKENNGNYHFYLTTKELRTFKDIVESKFEEWYLGYGIDDKTFKERQKKLYQFEYATLYFSLLDLWEVSEDPQQSIDFLFEHLNPHNLPEPEYNFKVYEYETLADQADEEYDGQEYEEPYYDDNDE